VLFTAVNSPFGGSAKLFTLNNTKLFVSNIVLHEVEKNIRKKLAEVHLKRFFRLVDRVGVIEGIPSKQEIDRAKRVIVEKDAVILAEFKRSQCSYLITLDKRDFLQEEVFGFVEPKKILSPKMFFEMI
jgi:predicted nucleic acid-binding protein